VIGKIYFLLVRLKIKHMELEVRRRESTGTGSDMYNESETITKFEIMDGAPVRGECVPVRLFLSSFDLTPTYRNVNNKFRFAAHFCRLGWFWHLSCEFPVLLTLVSTQCEILSKSGTS
jgi:hypothetical protein